MRSVSVVIPVYNRAHLIDRAIQSVLAQTYPAAEILTVDDASTDTTRDLLTRWREREPRIRPVFLPRNRGPAGARNAGVREARSDFIAFLDSDDAWLPEHLQNCMGLLEADRFLDLVFSDLRRVTSAGTIIHRSWLTRQKRIIQYLAPHPSGPDRFRFAVPEADVLFHEYVVPVQTTVIHAELARRFAFDERLFGPEDYELFLRLARSGRRFGYIDRVQCECFVHESNLVANGSTESRQCREWIKLWSGILHDPTAGRADRVRCHRHLSRLWHDQGYALSRSRASGQAIAAHLLSIWHRPSLRAMRGLTRAIIGLLATKAPGA